MGRNWRHFRSDGRNVDVTGRPEAHNNENEPHFIENTRKVTCTVNGKELG